MWICIATAASAAGKPQAPSWKEDISRAPGFSVPMNTVFGRGALQQPRLEQTGFLKFEKKPGAKALVENKIWKQIVPFRSVTPPEQARQ